MEVGGKRLFACNEIMWITKSSLYGILPNTFLSSVWDSAFIMRGFNTWTFFGTMSLIYTHLPVRNFSRLVVLG
jgi:hypothetical protein